MDPPTGEHLVLSRSVNGTLRTFNLETGEKVASWSIAAEDPARTSVTWWVLVRESGLGLEYLGPMSASK